MRNRAAPVDAIILIIVGGNVVRVFTFAPGGVLGGIE